MRVVVFIAYLFFLLPVGGRSYYPNSQTKVVSSTAQPMLALNKLLNFNKKEDRKVLLEVTDVDFEEEHLTSEEFHEINNNLMFGIKPLTLHNTFLANSNHYWAFFCKKSSPLVLPTQGNRKPIYIENKVLRI